MALRPEEAKARAAQSTSEQAEVEVAVFLKKNLANLKLIKDFEGLAVPPDTVEGDKEYKRMARELIDKGQFTSGITITTDDLDKQKEIQSVLGPLGAKSVRDLVPPRDKLDLVSDAVARGVEAETGTIGFLQGATVMNALAGLFQWIMSGFEGGFAGLKNTIAEITASKMERNVADNLREVRQNNPDMAPLLTDDRIASISMNVGREVREESELITAAPVEDILRNTKPESLDVQRVRNEIHAAVLTPEGSPPLRETLAENYRQAVKDELAKAKEEGWSIAGVRIPGSGAVKQFAGQQLKAPSEEQIQASSDKMAVVMADSISNTVTSPSFTYNSKNLGQLSQEDFSKAVAQQVAKDIKAKEGELGLAKPLDDAALAIITSEVEKSVSQNSQLFTVSQRIYGEKLAQATSQASNSSHQPNTGATAYNAVPPPTPLAAVSQTGQAVG